MGSIISSVSVDVIYDLGVCSSFLSRISDRAAGTLSLSSKAYSEMSKLAFDLHLGNASPSLDYFYTEF